MPLPFSPTKSIQRQLALQHDLVAIVESGDMAKAKAAGSEWSNAQHAHHTLLVAAGIIEMIQEMQAEAATTAHKPQAPGRRSWAILPVLVFGFIPKGKGKSPERFLSPPNISLHEIAELHAAVKDSLADLAEDAEQLAKIPARRNHPVLGPLTAAEWLRFLPVHTNHHLKILKSR